MKLFVNILLTILLLISIAFASVSCKPVKVIGHTIATTKSDSTSTDKTHDRNDSTHVSQTTEPKLMQGATVVQRFSKSQWDSIYTLLKTVPRGTVIYKTDPKTVAALSIALDSLGNLMLECSAKDRQYQETITHYYRIIQDLQKQVNETKSKSVTKEEVIKEQQKTFWQKVGGFFRAGGLWIIFIVIGVVLLLVKTYVPKV